MFGDQLENLQTKLLTHPIYGSIRTIGHLRMFMQAHVFAVWDFMSLAKRLQTALTCTQIPWMPPTDPESARFINEIILHEETDTDPEGRALSHLELYLRAMREVGASTECFERFLDLLVNGYELEASLTRAGVPEHVLRFVRFNVNLARQGSMEEVASCFLYGREDSIPKMFRSLLGNWGLSRATVPGMVYYLERHIEIDGEQHGPAARKILEYLIENDPARRARALRSAQDALMWRISLWDGIQAEIRMVDSDYAREITEPMVVPQG